MSGKWEEGEAEFRANKYNIKVISPPEEEKVVDAGKGAKDAKGKPVAAEEDEPGKIKI